MNTFVNAVANQGITTTASNYAITTNGMGAYESSLSTILDLFYNIGAARNNPNILSLFDAAYNSSKTSAMRTLFWARDVRGGAGERQTFRNILLHLEKTRPLDLIQVLPLVPEYGRFDDLLIFNTDQVKLVAYSVLIAAINAGNGLAAKWAPRKGPVAVALTKMMQLTPRQYRKTIVALTKVVETKMCAKEWTDINYSHVPSVAASRYAKAFSRHDEQGYADYVESVKSGEAKINASAIFPHDVLKARNTTPDTVLIQWEALPDYMNDVAVLPMIDVSGSMCCSAGNTSSTCLDVAVALGLYVATKQKGVFKNTYLTFDTTPELIKDDANIVTMANNCYSAPWGGSTDIEAGMKLILDLATTNLVPAADMPKILVVFSDMQFNQATHHYNERRQVLRADTAMETTRKLYAQAGYEMPMVVFWNLNGGNNNQPATASEGNVLMVSGFAPAMIKNVLSGKNFTPIDLVYDVINSDRYSQIVID